MTIFIIEKYCDNIIDPYMFLKLVEKIENLAIELRNRLEVIVDSYRLALRSL